jgi:glucose-6-phosphate 1-dehydrogenase
VTDNPEASALQDIAARSPSIIVIFGITGDLAQRKLLPALYHLFKDDLLDPRTVILGITRRNVTADELLSNVELCVNEIDKICDPAVLKKIQTALRMHTMSQTEPSEYQGLLQLMNDIESERGICMNRLYYLSIPPQMFETIVRNLGEQGLNQSCQHGNAGTRLLVEKPFGYDLSSARELIEKTSKYFGEEQLFRIDHYLAKDTVQNIIAFRGLDPAIEKIWNNQFVSDIAITAYEKIDIEGRAVFYEGIGAMRDFVQSHLLQLLAVSTMDLPRSSESEEVHKTRLNALKSIQPLDASNVANRTVRGQYAGYREEVQNPDSLTETYAEVRLEMTADRWKKVSMSLKTGKAMAEKRTDVCLTLQDSSQLIFHIQPDNGIELRAADKTDYLQAIELAINSFNAAHPPSATGHPDAYERVLLDAIRGDHTLFTTSEEVIAAWKVLTNVVEVWSKSSEGLLEYQKGAGSVA